MNTFWGIHEPQLNEARNINHEAPELVPKENFGAKTLSRSPSRAYGCSPRLRGEEILSAAMIVGEPDPLVGGAHDRMPVMLLPEDYDAWLPTTSPNDLRTLLRLPYDVSLMEAYAVSRKVISVKNDTEGCIEPIDDQQG